jgi:hypothetical protein
MKNVVLIDSDSLAFIGKTDDTLQQIIEKADYKIQAILDETKADYYALFVSQGKYFRHALKDKSEESGSYKSNRKYSNQNYNRVIKEYLIAKYNAVSSSLVEADDLIAYWMNKKFYVNYLVGGNYKVDTFIPDSFVLVNSEECNVILAAVDKDLLQSIPGKNLNYNKKQGDEWGMEWVETSESNADNFKRMQMVVGDSSDGILALKGKGIKYWEKLSAETLPSWGEILQLYCVDYGTSRGIYEFQKNYRLLHLLDCDEDYLREVGYMPTLPNFIEVIKENTEIKNEF